MGIITSKEGFSPKQSKHSISVMKWAVVGAGHNPYVVLSEKNHTKLFYILCLNI